MATPKLALIPTGYKAGKLYSVLPESGVGDFTVVRATEATRVNEAGLIETMGANVPRLDYSGGGCPVLLTEPQRTNLVTYSEDFSNAAWSKSASTITSNAAISPDGTLNASLFESTGAAGYMYPSTGILSSAANGTFTYSIYAKEGNTSSFTILIAAAANYTGDFNLTSVEASTSTANTIVDIFNAGNGWYRCSVTASLVASSAYSELQIGRISLGSNLYFYGASLEASSYPTIKTEGSAVTRNGDQVYGSGDAATFNDSEGVLMAEIKSIANTGASGSVYLGDGTNSNRMQIVLHSDGLIRGFITGANGGVTSVMESSVKNYDSFHKVSLTYNSTKTELWIDGFKIDYDNGNFSFNNGELNTLDFKVGGEIIYGKTSQLQYFNTALTDSELETLTSWTSFIEMAQAQNYNII
jgi:hypothetical protein